MQKVETNLSVNIFQLFFIIFWSVFVVVPSLGVHKFKELKTLGYLFSSFKDHKTF